jgi:hypothetical protein
VIDVEEGSPAFHAGLTPFDDYILGSHDIGFSDISALTDYVYRYAGEDVILYFYRASCDAVFTRAVRIPEGGSLGVEVANGRLHCLPNRETDGSCDDGGRVDYTDGDAGIDRRNLADFLQGGTEREVGSGSGATGAERSGAPASGTALDYTYPQQHQHQQQPQQQHPGGNAAQVQYPCPEEQATGRCTTPGCAYLHSTQQHPSNTYPQQQQQQQLFYQQQQHSSTGGLNSAVAHSSGMLSSTGSFGSAGFPQSPAPKSQQHQQQPYYPQSPQLLHPPTFSQQQQQQQQQQHNGLPSSSSYAPAFQPPSSPFLPAPIRIPPSGSFSSGSTPVSGGERSALAAPPRGSGQAPFLPALPRSPAPTMPARGASMLQPPSPFPNQ